MATPCSATNGCGKVSLQPNQTDNPNISFIPAPVITYSQMTNCTTQHYPAAETIANENTPSLSGVIASTVPMPGTDLTNAALRPATEGVETIPGQPDPPALFANVESGRVTASPSSMPSTQATPTTSGASSVTPPSILPEAPQFQVPSNPLLPPGYQETIDYENLQYLNGFLRTQIGKYIRVEQLIGSSNIEDRYGYLIGVGINYILLQELGTGNISALDYYNIKYVYIYYTTPELPHFK